MSNDLPERAPLQGHDTPERLSADDMATLHGEQFLQAAQLEQRWRASRRACSVPGICSNCGEPCLWPAVYCDEDCQSDHRHREATRARQGLLG